MNVSNFKKEVSGVKLPLPIIDKLGNLEWPKVNRDQLPNHVLKLGESIKLNGFLVGIPVTPVDKNGKRQVLNVNHGSTSLRDVLGLPLDTKLAMSEAWWVDPNDSKSVQKAIMTLNNDVSAWSIEQRIKSFAGTVGGIYETMRLDIVKYKKKGLTPASIVACYTTSNRGQNKEFKEGDFKLSTWRKQYVDDTLESFGLVVEDWNTNRRRDQSSIKANFLRELFRCLMLEAESMQNYTKWSKLLKMSILKTEMHLEGNGYVPTGDAFGDFWSNCKKNLRR
jgi:hypothetical protein